MATNEAVRLRAYELWDRTGRREGCALDHWLTAEAELAVPAEKSGGPSSPWGSPCEHKFHQRGGGVARGQNEGDRR